MLWGKRFCIDNYIYTFNKQFIYKYEQLSSKHALQSKQTNQPSGIACTT